MSTKTEFEITEKAGAFVAGVRSPGAGKILPLTEDQAYYALLAGELRRPDAKSAKPVKSTDGNKVA